MEAISKGFNLIIHFWFQNFLTSFLLILVIGDGVAVWLLLMLLMPVGVLLWGWYVRRALHVVLTNYLPLANIYLRCGGGTNPNVVVPRMCPVVLR